MLIQLSLEQGCTLRVIARSLQRTLGSISRELNHNAWTDPTTGTRKRGRPPRDGGHRAPLEQQRHRVGILELRRTIVARSPIAATDFRHTVPNASGVTNAPGQPCDHLHRALRKTRGELRTALFACLRQARKSRRPRSGCRSARHHSEHGWHDMRPLEIEDRVMPGHWEGDLIKSARNASAVGTLAGRTTLFVALAKINHATSTAAVSGVGAVLNRSNAQRCLFLTYDRGHEMPQPERVADMTGIKVYFGHPHSPRQRGINENTNGLLRKQFSKRQTSPVSLQSS